MDLTINQATASDIPFIMDTLTEAIQYKLEHDDTAWGSRAFSHEEISGMVASGLTYIVYLKGKPAGTFRLQWEDKRFWGGRAPDAGYIHLLAVTPDMHGLGIGEQIIDWALGQVAQDNRQFLRLDCRPDNKGLCDYYEKLGFIRKAMRQTKNDVGTPYIAALYERKV